MAKITKKQLEIKDIQKLIKNAENTINTWDIRVSSTPSKRPEYAPKLKVLKRWLSLANAKVEMLYKNLNDSEFYELGIKNKLQFF